MTTTTGWGDWGAALTSTEEKPMEFRNLRLEHVDKTYRRWLYFLDEAGHNIGEAVGHNDGRWTVTLHNGVSPSAYGLSEGRAEFASRTALGMWACDAAMQDIDRAAKSMTDLDLQRARAMLADITNNRAALAAVEARR